MTNTRFNFVIVIVYLEVTPYYNPQWGRFICADGQLNDRLIGANMYTYCDNNPVMNIDPDGRATISAGNPRQPEIYEAILDSGLSRKKYTGLYDNGTLTPCGKGYLYTCIYYMGTDFWGSDVFYESQYYIEYKTVTQYKKEIAVYIYYTDKIQPTVLLFTDVVTVYAINFGLSWGKQIINSAISLIASKNSKKVAYYTTISKKTPVKKTIPIVYFVNVYRLDWISTKKYVLTFKKQYRV